MSTTHGQPGLSSDQRSRIRSTILSTRHTLEDELRRQLEKYGIYEDKKLPLENLTHLSIEEIHTRRAIDAAIERELESTEGDLKRSITNYVREATKTYLNRFVALKTIEVRGLVEETITERPEYGNRSYIHHTVAEIAGELTNAPDDGFGAALDLAYQEIGAEIRMIFEESEHTALDLDAQVREEVLDELDAIDDGAWKSDEALGWVYQYFGEEEREDIDERVDEENYKIAGTDIATKTQLFTPRYIVEWMVDNSLGRTWLEMQDERTNIDDEENCFYLSPLGDSLIDRETKPVEDITVLDPACGSGHMLFYAFDVLYEMYLEEGEIPEKYIPREILRNNLYGIDIDSGAAQIAALSLYLKAKNQAPDVDVDQINVASADAVLINGEKKQEVLSRAQSKLEKEILDQLWTSFEHIREWGSLVRVEERIEEIIEDYRDELQAAGQTKFTQGGELEKQASIVSFSDGESESWDAVKERLLENTREIARIALHEDNPVDEMFAGEVSKTLELLDLLIYDYDVVITNPPYLGSGKMGDNLKQYVKDNYVGSRDLYAAFIERCGELGANDGYVSMVTPENFTFLRSYRKLRSEIIGNRQFIDGMHLSRYGFDQQKDAYTIPFILRNSDPSEFRSSRFYRMTHEQQEYAHYENKIQGLKDITETLRKGEQHDDVYIVDQNSFEEIDGSPFVYWFGQNILDIFDRYPSLEEIAEIGGGVKTGDNPHHLRKIWEIPDDWIGDGYELFVSHGDDREYYDQIDTAIRWEEGGENIKKYSDKHGKHYQGLSDTTKYFTAGVIFRKFGNEFISKYIPDNCIYSFSAYFVDGNEEISDECLLAHLNSSLHRFIMDGINPSVHFNPSDAGAAPIKREWSDEMKIKKLIDHSVNKRKSQFKLTESSSDFEPKKFAELSDKLQFELDLIDADVITLHNSIDSYIFEEFDIEKDTQERIVEGVSGPAIHHPHIENAGSLNKVDNSFRDVVPTKSLSDEDYQDLVADISKESSKEISEISEKLNISPYTVAMVKYNHYLYTNDEKNEIAGRQLSFYLGCAMGQWDFEHIEPTDDGILCFDGEVMESIKNCINKVSNEDPINKLQRLEEILDRDIKDWIRNRFFRYYHCKQYRRRGQRIPIYWQLESTEGSFSCFLFYHSIDENTLPKLRGHYLDPRINELENELETLNTQTSGDSPDKELLNRKEEVRNALNDIREFRETIDKMIDDGVTVDVEKGIWENIKEWDKYEVLETGLPKLKSSYSR